MIDLKTIALEILNSDISTTTVLDVTSKELSLMLDLANAVESARTAKENYNGFLKGEFRGREVTAWARGEQEAYNQAREAIGEILGEEK